MQNQTVHKNKFSHFTSLVWQSIKGGEYDYTQGSIRVAIVLLAVPMILELILESVFAVVDMYFVSHMKQGAKQAMATVGLTESVISIVYTLGFGVSMAATAVVARRIGEKDNEGAAHAGAQSILIGIALSIALSIAGVIFAPSVLKLMGAAPDVVKEGTPFARIMFGSSLMIIMLFLINGIYRGAGDATMAMRSLWIASGINVILCPLLIYGYGPFPELGLKGAAIATVIGRTTGVIYQCYHLFGGKRIIHLVRHHFKWDSPVIKTLVEVAWPATSQFFIQSGSWIVLSYLVSKTGSTDASAGYQVAIRNVVFFILPAWGLSNAAATLVGQNLGAKQPERAEASVWVAAKYNVAFLVSVGVIGVVFAEALVGFFTSDPEVLRYGAACLRIVSYGYGFYAVGLIVTQAFNG